MLTVSAPKKHFVLNYKLTIFLRPRNRYFRLGEAIKCVKIVQYHESQLLTALTVKKKSELQWLWGSADWPVGETACNFPVYIACVCRGMAFYVPLCFTAILPDFPASNATLSINLIAFRYLWYSSSCLKHWVMIKHENRTHNKYM